MIQSITSQGLVLYNRNFREDDKLVKIFTEQAGKRMFFVKHAGQSKLAPVIQPLVLARFLLRINDDGLSYIEDYHEVMTFPKINSDLFVMAYATYVAALADASLQDNQQDAALFVFLQKTLELMEAGLDYQVLTNIFEIQILTRFGISLNFNECVFCHRVGQAFDFSFKYGACLCPDHYHVLIEAFLCQSQLHTHSSTLIRTHINKIRVNTLKTVRKYSDVTVGRFWEFIR